MTARDVFTKAMVMLGYISGTGEILSEQEFLRRGMVAVNQVYSDLFFALGKQDFKPATSSNDVIDLPERVLHDVMPYGVAMFIAQSENDGDNQQLFANIYNKKRASIRTENTVLDILPKGSDY